MSESSVPPWVAITRSQHQGSGWLPRKGFAFAQTEQLAPVLLQELAHLTSLYTLAFVQRGETFQLVALLGVGAGAGDGRNLYINKDHQWLGAYVPALFRAHPFAFLKSETGESLLCIRQSHLVSEPEPGQAGVHPFFDESGELADVTAKMVSFLSQCEQGRQVTDQACAQLHALELLESWPLTIEREDQGALALQGLYKINEAKLNAVAGAELNALHQAGALKLAYAQLFSMHQLHQLKERAAYHAKQAPQRPVDLEPIFGDSDAGLNFDAFNLQDPKS